MGKVNSVNPVNVTEIVHYLLGEEPKEEALKQFLCWPPDVFAVCGYLLRESGAYVEVVKPWRSLTRPSADSWLSAVEHQAFYWLIDCAANKANTEIHRMWKLVMRFGDTRLTDIAAQPRLWKLLFRLVSVCDEASAGFGLMQRTSDTLTANKQSKTVETADSLEKINRELDLARAALIDDSVQMLTLKCGGVPDKCTETDRCKLQKSCHRPSTLCKAVHWSKVVVLPKMHTPQSGITIRSLTHNLALVGGSHVVPKWKNVMNIDDNKPGLPSVIPPPLNLLLIPWPKRLSPTQFVPVDCSDYQLLAGHHSFFSYRPEPTADDFETNIQRLCKKARGIVGKVDGIVFPEMALAPNELNLVLNKLMNEARFLISGVYETAANGQAGRNYAVAYHRVAEQVFAEVATQHKHHRWFLEKHQITQYGLGSSLHPDLKWWEYTNLQSRMIHFIYPVDLQVAFAMLICEDLARPDPTGDIIRAVGPNLVIALLQDGPQLAGRWAARYATVLADDPGSAVLTLTSEGMCELSRPSGVKAASRVVALWRDKDTGTREIELPPGHDAVVVSITNSLQTEWSADGRPDGNQTRSLRLSGVYPLALSLP